MVIHNNSILFAYLNVGKAFRVVPYIILLVLKFAKEESKKLKKFAICFKYEIVNM